MKPLALAALAGALLLGACSDKSDSDSGDPTAATSSAGSATSGATCYGVGALGAISGGQRIAEGTYQGGTLVDVESVVWLDAEGKMHAVTRATPYR